jgi:hypothetical protein
MDVHAGRGLEVESFWASIVWLGHFVGVPATWEVVTGWTEVTGPVSRWLAAPAKLVWLAATLVGLALATRAAMRCCPDDRAPDFAVLAGLTLLPVTAFVALNGC